MKSIKKYDEELAQRVRNQLIKLSDVVEKEMFGGLTFMVNGKMCVGIVKDELMCRVNPELHETLIEKTGCRTMDFTKKPMKGYIYVDEFGLRTQEDFEYWINLALDFNQFAKPSKKKKM